MIRAWYASALGDLAADSARPRGIVQRRPRSTVRVSAGGAELLAPRRASKPSCEECVACRCEAHHRLITHPDLLDKAALGRIFPDRQAGTGGTPGVHHLAIVPGAPGQPSKHIA